MAFALKRGLQKHTNVVHLKKKDHLCHQCDHAFGEASNLRDHIKAVHEKAQDHLCPVCGRAFSYEHNMKSHCKRVHGVEKSDIKMTFKNDKVSPPEQE